MGSTGRPSATHSQGDDGLTAVRFVVRGRVQGVGFRWWTRSTASRLGLRGHVRNLADGSVEVVAAGTDDALEALRSALREGPPTAKVQSVEETPTMPPDSDRFEVVH